MLASDEFHDVDTIAEQSKNVRSKGIREYVSKPFTENSVDARAVGTHPWSTFADELASCDDNTAR